MTHRERRAWNSAFALGSALSLCSGAGLSGCDQAFHYDVPIDASLAPSSATQVGPSPQPPTSEAPADDEPVGEGPASRSADAAATADASANEPAQAERCLTDDDCPLASLRCEVPSGLCFGCVLDEDCPASAPRCDGQRRCVACLVDEDCGPEFTCDRVSWQCQQRCAVRADCGPQAHDCDAQRGACVQCDSDFECRDATRPFCAGGGSGCVACRQASDCAEGLYCDPVTGACVQCRDTRDCPVGTACEPASLLCVSY